MNREKKTILNIFYWLLIVFLLLVASATAFSVIPSPWGYRLFIVQSASMEPAIKTGSVVIVMPQKKYKKGDIITFTTSPKANLKRINATVTHRITKSSNDEGKRSFTTKGDANKSVDPRLVLKQAVLGKVLFSIPYIGYPVAFAKTQLGFIILIVIPATIIVYSEIIGIKKEVIKIISARKKRRKEYENSN